MGESSVAFLESIAAGLKQKGIERLQAQGFIDGIETQVFLNLRFNGTDTAFFVPQLEPSDWHLEEAFLKIYESEFGFVLQADIIVDDVKYLSRLLIKIKGACGWTSKLQEYPEREQGIGEFREEE